MYDMNFFITFVCCVLSAYLIYRLIVAFGDKKIENEIFHKQGHINLMGDVEISTIKPSRKPFDTKSPKLKYNQHGQAYYDYENITENVGVPLKYTDDRPYIHHNPTGTTIMTGKTVTSPRQGIDIPWFAHPLYGHQGTSGSQGTSGTSGRSDKIWDTNDPASTLSLILKNMPYLTREQAIQKIKEDFRISLQKEAEYPYGKKETDYATNKNRFKHLS